MTLKTTQAKRTQIEHEMHTIRGLANAVFYLTPQYNTNTDLDYVQSKAEMARKSLVAALGALAD